MNKRASSDPTLPIHLFDIDAELSIVERRLASFPGEGAMLTQCESWKHFMAVQINRRLEQKRRFWEQDAFDHLLRSEEQFHYLRRYIAENPAKAHLGPGEFRHYSKPL